jgi:hypothetical protein
MKYNTNKQDVKVCDDGTLMRLLCFWTLSIILFLLKMNNVLVTGFCLRLMNRASRSIGPNWVGSNWKRWPKPVNETVWVLNKNGKIHNVYKNNNSRNKYIFTPSKPFPACCALASHSQATSLNSGNSSTSHAQVLSSQTPVPNWISSNFVPCL